MSENKSKEEIPEKYKNNCPLDHSTYEKFIECDCNFGMALDVWYFKQQEISQLKAENERLKNICNEFVYGEENPKYYKAMDEKIEKLKGLLKRSISMFKEVSGYSIPTIEKEIKEALGE